MGTTSTTEIGSDLWNARLYAGLSVASELAACLDKPEGLSYSLLDAWKMNRILNRLNRSSEDLSAAFERVIEHVSTSHTADIVVGPYGSVRDLVLHIQTLCQRALAFQAGFSRYGLLRRKLARLQVNSERLLDMADWLDAKSTPEDLDAKFDSALTDLANGDVVPWAAVQ